MQEGFKYRMSTSLIGTMDGPATEFQPPCHIRIASDNRNGQPQTNVCLFAVPTSPGHCRTFACQVLFPRPSPPIPSLFLIFPRSMSIVLLYVASAFCPELIARHVRADRGCRARW